MRVLPLLATLLIAVAALTGCGTDDPAAQPAHDAADVTFASDMSEHHQQALQMVALTEGRPMDDAFSALAAQIDAAQSPQIEQMNGWLDGWGEPVPAATAMGDMGSTGAIDPTTMPGMMSQAEMSALANAPDATFERRWLALMIKHHTGALGMARTELADGSYPDALALAQTITDTQTAEITRMRQLLAAQAG